MANIFYFYALSEELQAIWDCIADLSGIRFLESSSRPDMNIRSFDRFPSDEWELPNRNYSIVAWPSDVGGQPRSKEITFNDETRRRAGGKGMIKLTSPAFIWMHEMRPPQIGLIAPARLFYWTEKFAARYGGFEEDQIIEVDWDKLNQKVKWVKKVISDRSVGKWRNAPVSEGIAKRLEKSDERLWLWDAVGTMVVRTKPVVKGA